tara:strand:+ start:225 stop:1325 length:1101 start_codon:yes stop_codon:yes gene_type:complete
MAVDTWRLKAQSGQGRARKTLQKQIEEQMAKEKQMGLLSMLGGVGSTALSSYATPAILAALAVPTGGLGALAASTLIGGLTSYGVDKGLSDYARGKGWGADPSKIGVSGPWGYSAQRKARGSLTDALKQRDDDRLLNAMTSSLFANMTGKEGQKLLTKIGDKGTEFGKSISDKLGGLFGGGGKEMAAGDKIWLQGLKDNPDLLSEMFEAGDTAGLDRYKNLMTQQGLKDNPWLSMPDKVFDAPLGLEDWRYGSGYTFDKPQGLGSHSTAPKVMGLGSGGTPKVTGLGLGGPNVEIPYAPSPSGLGTGGLDIQSPYAPQGLSLAKAMGFKPSPFEMQGQQNLLRSQILGGSNNEDLLSQLIQSLGQR